MEQHFLEELQHIAGTDKVHQMEPMSRHTTFRVGGPADVLVQPDYKTLPDIIRHCRKYGENYFIVGNGSNLLVGDGGIRGVVIEMVTDQQSLIVSGDRVTAGAGMLLSKVANFAADHELTGMEFASGIPGSIGGAVVMNAGAYGGEMKDIIESATVLDAAGCEKILSLEELELGYRKSCIIKNNYVVTSVTLKLSQGNPEAIRDRMKELNEQRRAKQPLEYPSAGSTFKRPEGYFAGKLIMDAGLRGYRLGGAQVSEKHCGFVINREQATAEDIHQLIEHVSAEVHRQFGVKLEPEVKMVGER